MPTVVLADTTTDITVTATGYVAGSPGLTITWISDQEIQLDWIKGAGSNNTMVRAKIGSLPEDRDDGYLVYYGVGTTFTDTSVNLDEIGTYVYYRAWAEAEGVYEEEGDSGYIGGIGMVLIAIFILCGILTFLSLRNNNPLLSLVAALSWIFVFAYTRSNPIGDIETGSFADELIVYLCWGMAFVLLFTGATRYIRQRNIRRNSDSYTMNDSGEITSVTNTRKPRTQGLMDLSTDEYRTLMRTRLRRRR